MVFGWALSRSVWLHRLRGSYPDGTKDAGRWAAPNGTGGFGRQRHHCIVFKLLSGSKQAGGQERHRLPLPPNRWRDLPWADGRSGPQKELRQRWMIYITAWWAFAESPEQRTHRTTTRCCWATHPYHQTARAPPTTSGRQKTSAATLYTSIWLPRERSPVGRSRQRFLTNFASEGRAETIDDHSTLTPHHHCQAASA